MLADTGENLAQVCFGLDAIHFGGADQGIENGGPLTSGIAACKQTNSFFQGPEA